MRPRLPYPTWLIAILMVTALFALACGESAAPTSAPSTTTRPPATTAPTTPPTESKAVPETKDAAPTATPAPTGAPTAMPLPGRDNAVLVLIEEPLTMNPFPTQGGIGATPGKDNTVDPLTWVSGEDLRIVPTTATTSWEQLAPDKWRFKLRQGVKFHNGEAWNARAGLPSLDIQGKGNNPNSSFPQTGGYSAIAVDDYTLDLTCDQGCPLLPRTAFFLNFNAPGFMETASEADLTNNVVSFGPYKLINWQRGVELNQEAYADYLPADQHYEFQKPRLKSLKWLWRAEPTVMTAMLKSGEADLAWDVGVDQVNALPPENLKTGSSAEVFSFFLNTIWHPELKKVKVRQAIAHAVNCQEMIDSLYGGHTICRGNVVWPGVVGATEENTAPFTYDPALSRRLLEEADYDPSNVIRITGRGNRIPKQTEVYEAMQFYMKEVGVNAEINVVEASVRDSLRQCAIGKAVNEVLEASGRDPKTATATLEDMQAAVDKGGSNCPTADMLESPLSNQQLDFGLTLRYLNCIRLDSFFCDPSPGGIQSQIPAALASEGAERQRLMQAIADRVHEEVWLFGTFDTPVFYAVNPKLQFTPRYDRRVRANTLWFQP